MNMETNYKIIDTRKIVDYLNVSSHSTVSTDFAVSVEDIIRNSGADRLRVYPALFELEQGGWIEVVEREELGAPVKVRVKKEKR